MKKVLFFFLAFSLTNCKSKNEFSIQNLKEENPIYKNQVYEFPLLIGNKIITKKINKSIISELLELDIEKPHKSIFENIWATEEKIIPNLSFLKYKINRFDDKIYSITFFTEGCGAYCEEYSISYNYDLNFGNKISLDTIFSSSGKKTMLEKINSIRINIIGKVIKKLKIEKEKNTESYDIDDRINLLKECNNSEINSFEYLDYKIYKDSLIIYSEICSNHAMRALVEINKFKYNFEIKEIKNLLNSYGKNKLITK